MNTPTASQLLCITGLTGMVALCASRAGAQPNLLVDPGFENNSLGSYQIVLNDFVRYQGIWGAEAAAITGAMGPVVPPEGVRMLQVLPTGGITSQVVQVTDVTRFATEIDSRRAVVSVRGLFNADPAAPEAYGSVVSHFYTGPGLGFKIGHLQSSLYLDTDPSSWEEISGMFDVPVGTRWLVTQLYYSNESMNNRPCYVDATSLTINGRGGGFELLVEGSCPGGGPLRISWFGATSGGWVVLMHALNEGAVTIPRIYPCGGTVLGLGSRRIQTVWHGPSGTNGSGSITDTAGPRACGTYLQLLDLANCETTDVVPIE